MVMAMERVIVSIDLRLVTNRHSYLMVTGIVMVTANANLKCCGTGRCQD